MSFSFSAFVRRLCLLLGILSVGAGLAAAQTVAPPQWTFGFAPPQAKVGDEVELVFRAQVPTKWYLYSSDFDPDLGPIVTTFAFEPHPSYERLGEVRPVNPKKKYDDIWEGEYTYFEGTGEFRQRVKILATNPQIRGEISYQICTEVDGRCVNFDTDFDFRGLTVGAAAPTPEARTTGAEPPATAVARADTAAAATSARVRPAADTTAETYGQPARLVPSAEPTPLADGSLWAFMLLAFGSGLVALLTPCVFPMIPMTVTFFTKTETTRAAGVRKALLYGLSIIAIYTVAGTLVSRLNGPEFANWLSTHWLPNVFFFGVFIFFALAFLGMFEIVLPAGLVNRMDKQADRGGLIGVFFMAFTLVLVSFSCTGPIVGSLLVASAGGEMLKPIAGMFAFALAFALPFTLFAVFPSWLSNLPKSGGWLNSVKVVLGFLELALAFKFLSVADQAYHWNLLDRDVYLAIWIAVFTGLALYLFGKLRLPHDSPVDKIGVPRLLLGLLTLTFVVYLVPGMFGAPLKPLAGYLPPQNTLDFDIRQQTYGALASGAAREETGCEPPRYANLLHLPHGLRGYFDYEQALACARRVGKPVFVDFTGHGCVNCREMEARVWADPRVLRRLQEDYVVVALYVDDKTELPEADWYVSDYDQKRKTSIGKQNADLQIRRFNNNAQPFYVLLDPSGELLHAPQAYDLNADNFVRFLDAGLAAFAARTAGERAVSWREGPR